MRTTLLATFTLFISVTALHADDWPQWRYNAQRGASTPHELPAKLHLQWVRTFREPQTAWPKSQGKLQFDSVPQAVVMDNRVFVPSTVNDTVTAYNTATGGELWRFYAEAPVRFAPVAHDGKVYFVSDDGHLYCVRADSGKLEWKVNGGPEERWIIGNDRLTSSWPCRGGSVLHKGKIFFTASIWPFMGIFIHAVDPQTGEILWTNSGDGTNFITHPHGAKSFGTVVPQGHLAASGDYLIVPGGRSTPAVYDIHTGKLLHFQFDGRRGGHHVMAGLQTYYIDGQTYETATGKSLFSPTPIVGDEKRLYFAKSGSVQIDSAEGSIKKVTKRDRKGRNTNTFQIVRKTLASVKLDGGGDVYMTGGSRIYTGASGRVAAHAIDDGKLTWSAEIEGKPAYMAAGDGRLFVMTAAGKLYCFGADKKQVAHYSFQPAKLAKVDDKDAARTLQQFGMLGVRDGFALVMGIEDGTLVQTLLADTKLFVIGIDKDEDKIDRLRRQFDKAGLYGKRVSLHVGDPASFRLPPYLASVAVSEKPGSTGFFTNSKLLQTVFQSLRPYGGLLCIPSNNDERDKLTALAKNTLKLGGKLRPQPGFAVLVREGPLPDTDMWTHQYGNAAQTAVSRDKSVKAPFGLLWFGGPSHDDILPRHGHGPSPQVAGGRLFIEGPDLLRSTDVYTGRLLWERKLPDFGKYYNITRHFAGAGEIGSNYVSLPDKVYAVHGDSILALDAATGQTTRTFQLPAEKGKERPYFGFIAVQGDYLITTASPIAVQTTKSKKGSKKSDPKLAKLGTDRYGSGSRELVVFDRHTGKLLWTKKAAFNFRHNNIVAADGKIFCVDSLTDARKSALARRGIKLTGKPTLYALDAKTGNVIWSADEHVFGTFLNYSEEHDILLQAGSQYRDRASDENRKGMVAFQGRDGKIVWKDLAMTYGGPCLLWRDKIITNGSGGEAYELLTGKATGWKYKRMYGCNTAVGSEHLLTFRSGSAGFCDLTGDSGTGNIGGFRSSCTNNLIVADGVLSATDYTRTCSCAYQNQTSLGLIHMPQAEFWTFGATPKKGSIGLNLGAPGDRRAKNGTLWKSTGGKIEPEKPAVFRYHSSFIQGDDLPWVAANGVQGVSKITLPATKGQKYQVKLYFLEPELVKAGERVFDVVLQDKVALPKWDVFQQAGGARKELVRSFDVTPQDDEIVIEFRTRTKRPAVLSGVEVIGE